MLSQTMPTFEEVIGTKAIVYVLHIVYYAHPYENRKSVILIKTSPFNDACIHIDRQDDDLIIPL
jgi:hypothetical protein